MNHRETKNVADVRPWNKSILPPKAKVSQFRRMTPTIATIEDMQAFDALAARCNPLTERHYTQSGLPSPQALQMATDAVGGGYVLPATRLHPVVASAIMTMSYDLMSYGLAPAEPDLAATHSSGPHCVGKHVLVVDDTSDVLVAVGAFLAGEGFAAVCAPDGDTALRLIAADPRIGVLVTDYAMPGLSGIELIAQAVQMRPNLKALLITAYPNADGLADLPSHIKVLTKPFRRAALTTQVKTLVSEAPSMLPDEAMELVENRQL
jgi:CheY-like chemotaxis protein